jgi:trimeric autotransporter adhesin
MSHRGRPFPALALLLAAAVAIALTVATGGPAGALVSPTPDWGDNPPCQANGRVIAVAYSGNTLYLGGQFSQVGGQPRNNLAACNATNGTLVTTWNPNANGAVRAIKVSNGGRVYVGGDFTSVGGSARSRIASLSPASGATYGFNPGVNNSVKALTFSNSGSTVYAGGDFGSAAGATRSRLAAFNATTGALTSLAPSISNGTAFATVLSMDVSADGTTLYFAGDFARVSGSSRRNAAAVSSGVGSLRAWNPSSTGDVVGELTLSTSGRTVFVGGRATGGYVQAYGPTTGGAPVWNVQANGDVEALAIISSTLYVGGHFTNLGGNPRNHLAAMSASGSVIAGWNPTADGALGAFGAAITSSRVAFGGEFDNVGGQAHEGVVQFIGAA